VIPQGTGWQYLRALSLDTIPVGTSVFHTRATPLHDWRIKGTFQVNTCSKKLITIETAGIEIGSTLLADVEYLLDHAAEHQAAIHDSLTIANWYSPAWTLVTTYYWSFFSALALSRLVGRSVWFLDRAALIQLEGLSGSGSHPPPGAMYLNVGGFVSATNREVTLEPSRTKFHEAAWLAVHKLISDVFAHADEASNPLEYRLWWSLKRAGERLGTAWPSVVRNKVNYRPGWGYREVRRDRVDTMKKMRQSSPLTFAALAEDLENQVIAIRANIESLGAESQLLGSFTLALSALVKALHEETVTRQNGDQRWGRLRNAFYDDRCSTGDNPTWPFSDKK